MKLTTISLCVVVVYLYVSLPSTARAQSGLPSCEDGSQIGSDLSKLLAALQASPSDQCKDQLLAIVQVTDFVAQAQTVFPALFVICEPTCLEYVRNFAENCRPSYVVLLQHACARNEHAVRCYQTVLANNGTSLLMQCFPEQFQLAPPIDTNQISTTEPSPNDTDTSPPVPAFTCSNECRGALETFRALHGCCVTNAFNSTTFGLQQYGIANYSLWGACGVDTVDGFCPSPFESAVVTTTLATDSSLPFIAHTLLTSLSLLMALLVLF